MFHIDQHWCNYLSEITDIRDSIHFRRLGGQEPLFEFHKLSIGIFSALIDSLEADMLNAFSQIDAENDDLDLCFAGMKSPSSTWTYLVNDETFEDILGIHMVGNIALSAWAGLFWPIAILLPLIRKVSRRAGTKRQQREEAEKQKVKHSK